MNRQTYNTNNVASINNHKGYTNYFNNRNKNDGNDNGGGGDDMEKRLSKLEAGIDYIKEKLISHDARLDKIENISTKLEFSEKVINIKLDNLKENCISYKGLFGMFAVFTAIIGFLIKFIH